MSMIFSSSPYANILTENSWNRGSCDGTWRTSIPSLICRHVWKVYEQAVNLKVCVYPLREKHIPVQKSLFFVCLFEWTPSEKDEWASLLGFSFMFLAFLAGHATTRLFPYCRPTLLGVLWPREAFLIPDYQNFLCFVQE